jgi:hypothetical protein
LVKISKARFQENVNTRGELVDIVDISKTVQCRNR